MKHIKSTVRPVPPSDRYKARLLSLPKVLPGGQAGYTLIEMLIVIAIMGILGVAISQAVAHTVRISQNGTDSITAITQIENAFRWTNIDVQQSQTIEPEMGNGFPLSLSWVEWDGTLHDVTYAINGDELTRSISINSTPSMQMAIARYLNPDEAATTCRLTGNGNFNLTDSSDAFTITGGQESSSGQISVSTGSISVSTTGTATYNSGEWSTPAAGDQVIISATSPDTKGTWNSANTGAWLALTNDIDGDANIVGSTLLLTLTAFGGENSTHSETRQVMIFSRS